MLHIGDNGELYPDRVLSLCQKVHRAALCCVTRGAHTVLGIDGRQMMLLILVVEHNLLDYVLQRLGRDRIGQRGVLIVNIKDSVTWTSPLVRLVTAQFSNDYLRLYQLFSLLVGSGCIGWKRLYQATLMQV